MIIRNERPDGRRAIEELTREAFWDVYVPGCRPFWISPGIWCYDLDSPMTKKGGVSDGKNAV